MYYNIYLALSAFSAAFLRVLCVKLNFYKYQKLTVLRNAFLNAEIAETYAEFAEMSSTLSII